MFRLLRKWRIELLLFAILVVLVPYLEFSLLQPVLKLGMASDDWKLLFSYKTFSTVPLIEILTTWRLIGPYIHSHIYFIGILESIFGVNFLAFHIASILLKILSILLLYLLILIVSKRRLLAFLGAIIFAIIHSSTGSLQVVIYGTEHLAISLMFIFFIAYYYSFEKGKFYHVINKFSLLVVPLTFLLAFLASPIRIYPLLIFLPLLEIFFLVQVWSKKNLINSAIIIFAIFLPILYLQSMAPRSTSGYFTGGSVLFNQITKGMWQVLILPFSGLGYIFVTDDFLNLLGGSTLILPNTGLYLFLKNIILFYGLLTLLLSLLLSKSPLRFFFSIFFVNLLAEVLLFWSNSIPGFVKPVGFGIYILIAGFFIFVEWLTRKKDILLIYLAISVTFSVIFLWSTWLILGGLGFSEPTHRYLVMPSIGASLFIATILTILCDRFRENEMKSFKNLGFIFSAIFLIFFYQTSSKEINRFFNNSLDIGAGAKEQLRMTRSFTDKIKHDNKLPPDPVLVYFETGGQDLRFYEVTLNLQFFGYWVHLIREPKLNGCVGITDKEKLKASMAVKSGQKGFNQDSFCVEHNGNVYGVGMVPTFYKPENFYAFKLINRDLVDIKQKVLQDLGF